jgi:hypothetical protein
MDATPSRAPERGGRVNWIQRQIEHTQSVVATWSKAKQKAAGLIPNPTINEQFAKLPEIRKAAEAGLKECKGMHNSDDGIRSYCMKSSARVCDVGLKISDDGEAIFYVDIDDANDNELCLDVYKYIHEKTGCSVDVTSEW